MKSNLRTATSLLLILIPLGWAARPAAAQVAGLGSCQRDFDVESNPDLSSCTADGVVAHADGQLAFFGVRGRVQAVPGLSSDIYDVQLNLSASGEFPDGFLFGHAQVRSTNGATCDLDLGSAFDSTTCLDMFSSDGVFTVTVEAFSGQLPG